MKVLSLRFSKACKTYDQWAIPQKYSAERLKALCEIKGFVLDIGCGTGIMSEGIEKVVGIDISIGMLRVYKEKFDKAILGDAQALPFRDKSFDFVVSNFALHWTDIRKSIPEALRVCKRVFLCAIPVEGSLPEMGFPFPKVEDVKDILSTFSKIKHFFVEEVPIPFRGWDLVKFFHYTGSSYNPNLKSDIISKRRIESMISIIDSPSFRVLFFLCEVKS